MPAVHFVKDSPQHVFSAVDFIFFMKINKFYYYRWRRVLLTSSQNVTSFKIFRISKKIDVLTQETGYESWQKLLTVPGQIIEY